MNSRQHSRDWLGIRCLRVAFRVPLAVQLLSLRVLDIRIEQSILFHLPWVEKEVLPESSLERRGSR